MRTIVYIIALYLLTIGIVIAKDLVESGTYTAIWFVPITVIITSSLVILTNKK